MEIVPASKYLLLSSWLFPLRHFITFRLCFVHSGRVALWVDFWPPSASFCVRGKGASPGPSSTSVASGGKCGAVSHTAIWEQMEAILSDHLSRSVGRGARVPTWSECRAECRVRCPRGVNNFPLKLVSSPLRPFAPTLSNFRLLLAVSR